MFNRVRWGLVGWNVLVLWLILTLAGALVYVSLARSLIGEVDRDLLRRSNAIVMAITHERSEGRIRPRPEIMRGAVFSLLLGPDGRVLENPENLTFPPEIVGLSGNKLPRYATIVVDGEPARLYIQPLPGPQFGPALFVIGQSIAAEESALHQLVLILATVSGTGLLVSILGAWFLAGRALVPIRLAFQHQQEFVAAAAHELRTPLTVLHAATDLLHQHRAEPLETNGELFDDVRQEIVRLERLAGDLLTLARSDLQEIDLAIGQLDLGPLTTDVARRMVPLAQEAGIRLTDHGGGESLWVEGDPDRLHQVLLIMLDNAVKHTPPGGSIRVAARRQGSEAVVEVSDTGEGIAAEDLPHVFDRFYRGDRSRSRTKGSTGLGLAIAKSLVDAHHGTLTLSSVFGSGTVATIRLPLLGPAPSLAERLGSFAARVTHHAARQ
ncbi:MAG: ATP-binding protein [Ardenticatenaceae bacterium]|nr:ATP-binding protein [Ardenticatenaceae bacterium]